MINKFEVARCEGNKSETTRHCHKWRQETRPWLHALSIWCQSRYTKQGDYQPSSQIIVVGTETR